MRIYYLLLLWNIFHYKKVYACTTNAVQYVKSGESVTLQFKAVTVNPENADLFVHSIIRSPTGNTLLTVLYINGAILTTNPTCNGCIFVGNDSTGNISIRIDNLQAANGGTYKHSTLSPSVDVKCVTVYILGVPEKPVITSDNNNVVGLDTTLSCSSKSTTRPTDPKLSLHYSWNVNNPDVNRYVYSQTKHTLIIKSLNKTDSQETFTCTATESGDGVVGETSFLSRAFVLVVIYGPDVYTTTLSPDTLFYTRNEGDSLNDITCSGDCFPRCKYRWTNSVNNEVVSINNVLSLDQLTRAENAAYTCTVTNANRTEITVTKTVTVIVRYGPDSSTTILSPTYSVYTKNEGVTLNNVTCSGNCFPSCGYKWTKQGATGVVNVSNNKVLSLGSLDRTEAAEYTCAVSNPATGRKQTKHITVYVRYGPNSHTTTLYPTKLTYTLEEGKILPDIKCVGDCYPACSYRWTKLGNKEVARGDILSLGTLTREHATVYTCLVTNTQKSGSVTKNVAVNVIYPPDVSIISSTKEYVEGKPLTLTCDAKGNPNTYKYNGFTQTFGDSVIHNGHSFISGTLHIPSLQVQDTGNYTCYVNNGVKLPSGELKDSTNSVFVCVQVPPKILTDQLRFAGATDETAFIQVKLYSYPDIKKATIVRYDGFTITDVSDSRYEIDIFKTVAERYFYNTYVSLDGTFLNMSISNLQQEDFGNYTLVLENEIGITNATVFLDAESVPSKPMYFVYSYEDGSHKFSWVGGFNGGHRQTFVIQTSVAGLDEWVNQTSVSERERNKYSANISYISPGTYTSRIFAWNVKGLSTYVVLNETLTIKDNFSERGKSGKTAIVAAAVSSVMVVIAIILSLLFLRRRTVREILCSSKEPSERKNGQTTPENSYYNLSSIDRSSGQPEPESSIHYEVLKGSGRVDTSQTYDSLQRREDMTALNTASHQDISSGKTAKENKDAVYENLKLKRKDETV